MRLRTLRPLVPVLALAALGFAISSCGSSGGSSTSGAASSSAIPSEFKAVTSAPSDAQTGGKLTVLALGDIDYMDPGAAYYQFTYMLDGAVQSPLVGWKPDDTTTPSPLLATSYDISSDNKSLTFHLNPDVHFSPPVDRAVTSADVKYAVERSLLPGVPNGYTAVYLGDLEGFDQAEKAIKQNDTQAPNISGIQTPDKNTVVFNLTQPTAPVAVQALSLPVSAPVPEEYAKQYDSQTPSTYGQYTVFTGPYMVQNDCVDSSGKVTSTNCSGKLSGYSPGKEIDLVRNPNWKQGQDFRPAYLDNITFQEGFSDPTSASTKILSGSDQVSGDFVPDKSTIQQVATGQKYNKDQLSASVSGGNRYIALNMSKPPFDDINVRKAVVANSDRTALRNTRGGDIVGAVATHFIPPGIPGFDEAGGYAGPDLDFIKNPNGDPAVAKKYMQKAGYSSGKCEGSNCSITMVGDNTPPGLNTATVFKNQLEQLGFKVQFQPVEHSTMYTKFCSVVASEPNVCPNVGWIKDFIDAQSILQVPFDSQTITSSPANNSNWSQMNIPAVDKGITNCLTAGDQQQRAECWGKLDDQIMSYAPAVPWVWDNETYVRSNDVNGVVNLFNAEYDLSYTSLSSG